MNENNDRLALAFPSALRSEARIAVSYLPEDGCASHWRSCSVTVAGEVLSIPERIYHDASGIADLQLPEGQMEIIECLLTRHADGHVRERHLSRIVRLPRIWLPAFVVRLAGEYVVEILRVIEQNLQYLDKRVYREFLVANPSFVHLIQKRIVSYWDCYYRQIKKEEYPGFTIAAFFEELVR